MRSFFFLIELFKLYSSTTSLDTLCDAKMCLNRKTKNSETFEWIMYPWMEVTQSYVSRSISATTEQNPSNFKTWDMDEISIKKPVNGPLSWDCFVKLLFQRSRLDFHT